MHDSFDALQVLRDNDVISDDAYKAVLAAIAEGSTDTDDKRRAAFILWDIDNGNSCNPDDAEFDGNSVSQGRMEFLVLTDDEADEVCAERIGDSLWAFRPGFLACETGMDEMVFEALADKCEGANDAVRSIIDGSCGFDSFVDSAKSADGRGHFISSYDGEENEFSIGGEWFYIYRVN